MNTWKRKLQHVLGAALVLSLLATSKLTYAATGSIYISPASKTVTQNQNVTLSVRINPGTNVDSVYAVFTYDANKLTYQSISYAGSPFTTQVQESITSGSITVLRGEALGGSDISTDSLIMSVTLKAKPSSGNTPVTLGGSYALSNGTNTNPSLASGNVTFSATAPTTKPKPTKPGTPAPKPTPTPPANTPPADTTPPKVTLTPLAPGFTTANFNITSDEDVKARVEYGLTSALGLASADTGFTKSTTLSLNKVLAPGTSYYFRVHASDKAGNAYDSTVQQFTTKGITVNIVVLDKNYKPLAGKTFELHSTPQSASSNSKGVVQFKEVAPGTHTLVYKAGGKQYSQTIEVANSIIADSAGTESAKDQNISAVYAQVASANALMKNAIWVVPVVLLILAGLYARRKALVQKQFAGVSQSSVSASQPDVNVVPVQSSPVGPNAPGGVISPNDRKGL